jgi:hypothetical protein
MRKPTRRKTYGRGAKTEQLKKWASKAMNLIKKHGPGLARKYKLGSRALSYAAKRNPKYATALNMGAKFADQRGYGLRSVGGMRRRRCR